MQEACKCRHGASSAAHDSVFVYHVADDLGLWHVLMEGPEDTPYEGRWFRLWVKFGEDYPLRPPEVRFVTPVLHVNINHEGRICHGAFGTAYTSDTSAIVLLGEVGKPCYLVITPHRPAMLPSYHPPSSCWARWARSAGCSPSPYHAAAP